MKNTFNEIIKKLFERALELNLSEREIFFDNLPKDEYKYIEEVKSLIIAYEKNKDFLEIENTNIYDVEHSGPHPLIGKRIGSYLIEEEIGIGGMGVVFIGQRDDKVFDQRVAIKILKQGISSEYLVKRFQNERQTLANLQHPNIAKLFDGGKTSEGLPYLIMEFIDGVPITEFCKEKQLSIDARLRLFIKVCKAVQYAHQNLIIHRDIKPGNILVNKEGRPKLLDFGVAKLLDKDLEFSNSDLTKTGMWHLTPEFASPEQIVGKNITTASDIYSLGVLLYNLLSGFAPYKITNNSPLAINKIINEEKILKPSEIVTQQIRQKLDGEDKRISDVNLFKISSKKLKGDLDNIILKAMHKDPDQRYLSVQDFANDINNYLNGLPIKARKDTLSYRTSKFIKRHKVGVALFILFNILVFAGIAAIIYQGRIAAIERDKAKLELSKFEEINNFLQDMLTSADPAGEGKDVKVYEVLEKATSDVEIKLKDFPKIRAAIKQSLGSTYIGLGEFEKAKKLLYESLESCKLLFGEFSKESAVGYHQLGLCYDWIGDYAKADSLYKKGILIFNKVDEIPSKALANNLNDFGTFLTNKGLYDSSAVTLKRALEIYAIHNPNNGQKEAITVNNLAVNLHHQWKIDEAEKYYLEAEKILTNLYGRNRPEIASIMNNLAYIYMDNKDYQASEEAFKKSYEIKLAVLGEQHPSVALALINTGMLEFVRKNYEDAEILLLNAVEHFEKLNTLNDPYLSLAYYWLGRTYLEINQLFKAERVLKKSIEIRELTYTANSSKTWSSKGELGICMLKQKRYKEAEKLLVGSIEFYLNDSHRDIKKLSRYSQFTGILYSEMGDSTKANYYQLEYQKFIEESETE